MPRGAAKCGPPTRSERPLDNGVIAMTNRSRQWTGRVAFAIGAVLAAGVVAAERVPGGTESLRGSLVVGVTATGGLAVSPEGRLLAARRIGPGARAIQRRVRLFNQTSAAVRPLVRVTGPGTDLDDVVRLELRLAGSRPLHTSLGRLRRWRPLGRALPSQRGRRVTVRAWIPAAVRDGYQARRAAVVLEFTRAGAGA